MDPVEISANLAFIKLIMFLQGAVVGTASVVYIITAFRPKRGFATQKDLEAERKARHDHVIGVREAGKQELAAAEGRINAAMAEMRRDMTATETRLMKILADMQTTSRETDGEIFTAIRNLNSSTSKGLQDVHHAIGQLEGRVQSICKLSPGSC